MVRALCLVALVATFVHSAPLDDDSTSININEMEAFHSQAPKNGSALHRGITLTKAQRYKDGIVPYAYDTGYTAKDKDTIAGIMEDFTKQTGGCIKFVARTTETDFVTIVKGDGCASISMPGFRRLWLDDGCIYHKAAIPIVHHEIMHQIGFQHEQNRPDRDEYITVMWDNIQDWAKPQYAKGDAENLNVPYDYNSQVHYNTYDMAIDPKKPTMVAKNGHSVGNGDTGMTALDILKIRRAYGCEKGGEASTPKPPPAFAGIRFKDCDNSLEAGVSMFPGQKIVSPGGKTELRMTTEGNLILVDVATNDIIFQTRTTGYRAEMQRDGNFVVYDKNNKAQWSTRTDNYNFGNRGATQVVVLDNGTFSVLDKAGKAAWSNEGALGGTIPL